MRAGCLRRRGARRCRSAAGVGHRCAAPALPLARAGTGRRGGGHAAGVAAARGRRPRGGARAAGVARVRDGGDGRGRGPGARRHAARGARARRARAAGGAERLNRGVARRPPESPAGRIRAPRGLAPPALLRGQRGVPVQALAARSLARRSQRLFAAPTRGRVSCSRGGQQRERE